MKLDETKLLIPAFVSGILRHRLFQILDQSLHSSFIAVSAPEGYGKTLLISSFLKYNNLASIWYSLEETDLTPDRFLTYLKTGIHRRLENNTNNYIVPPEDLLNETFEMAALLASLSEPLIIVLDHYHLTESSAEIRVIIHKLIETASPYVTFFLVGSSPLQGDWAKLKSSHAYLELTVKDLAFSKEETGRFFQHTGKVNLLPAEIELIIDKTEGWVAAYSFITKDIAHKEGNERVASLSQITQNSNIASYFSNIIMAVQNTQVRDFLYHTSLFTELDASIIDQYMGYHGSEAMLEYLKQANLFIVEEDGICRYHSLFRAHLYENLKKNTGIEIIKQKHVEIAKLYENRFEYFNAFAHYIAGANYLMATRCMDRVSSRYNPLELMALADGWVEKAAPGLSMAYTTIFLARCYMENLHGELIGYLETRIEQFKESENVPTRMLLAHRLATFYTGLDISKAMTLYAESLDISTALSDHPITAYNLNGLADLYRLQGQLTEAMTFARRSLFIAEKHNIKAIQLLVLDTMANIYLDQGMVSEAELYAHQALELSEEYDLSILFVVSTISRKLRLQGDLAVSIEWANKAYRIADAFCLHFDKGWALFELAQSLRENGQSEESEKMFAESCKWMSAAPVYVSHFSQVWKSGSVSPPNPNQTLSDAQIIDSTIKLEISVLGRFTITLNGEPVNLARSSSLRILQYLITFRDRKISKDMILEDLFSTFDIKTASNYFHVALSALRRSLEHNPREELKTKVIQRQDGLYYLDFTHITLDVDRYIECITQLNGTSQIASLLEGERLYAGDFFSEFPYESFLEIEREKLRLSYLRLLENIAQYYQSQNQYLKCFEYYDKLINKDPYREEFYLEYISLLKSYGMLSHAKHMAAKMERFIHKELGLDLPHTISSLMSRHTNP